MNASDGKTEGKQDKQHFGKAYGGKLAENYQKYFVPTIGKPIATILIEKAGIKEGEKVIDVACGTGVAAFLAREKTGDEGEVAGVDINAGMLGVARSITTANNSIDWYESSANQLPLNDNIFDVAICNLSLQLFPDKPGALKEIYRVLAPGGRLTFIVPGPTPIFKESDSTFVKYLGEQATGFVRAVFSLSDYNEIKELIDNAGFKDINVRSEKKELLLPAPDVFLWQYLASTPLSSFIEKIDKETYTKMENEIVEKWKPFVSNNNLILEHDTIIATGRK